MKFLDFFSENSVASMMRLLVFIFSINAILLSWIQAYCLFKHLSVDLSALIYFFGGAAVTGKIGQKLTENKTPPTI